MTLAAPIMLLGLLALPALAALYWLRSRSRPQVVSSLFLYEHLRQARTAGRLLERMQTPLTFFLEMLALAGLVLAAAGPQWARSDRVQPIVVVLDDSLSMQAGCEQSAHARGLEALLAELQSKPYQAKFVLAGAQPLVLPEATGDGPAARKILEAWHCRSPQSDLARAVALAGQIGGPDSRILVLTDYAPTWDLQPGTIQWWAFGTPRPNVGFTAAARMRTEDGQRLLVKVANFSSFPCHSEMTLGGQRRPLDLGPNQRRQFVFDLPADAGLASADLPSDALEGDNHVWLLPPSVRVLRVQVALPNGPLRSALLKAVQASGRVLVTDDQPDMIVSNGSDCPPNVWHLRIMDKGMVQAFAGPFVIDRNHPLTDGLSLAGTIWACPEGGVREGTPIITAGNTVLLSARQLSGGVQRLGMAFSAEQSTLSESPDWPILLDNLVQWRLASLQLPDPNVRLGTPVHLHLGAEIASARVEAPQAGPAEVSCVRGWADLLPTEAGLHTVSWDGGRTQFAVNALCPGESDLSSCREGKWGDWQESLQQRDRTVNLSWVAALLALAALAALSLVVWRSGGGRA